MSTFLTLKQNAISAAKNADWSSAVAANEEILTIYPDDTAALNRLGVAYLQLGETKKAKKTFEKVLEQDKTNTIAKKHLATLASNKTVSAPTFSSQNFIEEPGKTATVELHRLAGKQVIETLTSGQECSLKQKNRYISVVSADKATYIGALPEDLSFRLSKLMTTGNIYSCFIRSVSPSKILVHLREKFRSEANSNTYSFPPNKQSASSLSDIVDERLLLSDDVPIQIVHTDSDEPDLDLASDFDSNSSDDRDSEPLDEETPASSPSDDQDDS